MFIGPKIPFPLSWERERKRNRKRKRSMFEPIPNNYLYRYTTDMARTMRRLARTQRFLVDIHATAAENAPNQAAQDAMMDPNGVYLSMMGAQARTPVFRSFGFFRPEDRRIFFEDTGRLSFVIYRARIFFQRRLRAAVEKIYQQLRLWGLPRELAAKTMTYYRDALPPAKAAPTYLTRFRHLNIVS